MKAARFFFALLALLTLSIAASAANPVVFNLKEIPLANGWRVTGTITTDGTVDVLTAANILDWNLKVVQTTDMIWTEKDSNVLNISGVSTDGLKIVVATSPDGITDSGTLYFGRGGSGGRIPTNAVIADFTQLSVNLGYGYGGIAGWQDELGGLNYIGLGKRIKSQYRAGTVVAGQPKTFRLSTPTLATSPLLMTMFGTMTTDGTIGLLLPQNILTWKVTARSQDIRIYTKLNTVVLAATGLSSNGTGIQVDRTVGQFMIGVGGRRPTYLTIADFTDPTQPNGFANYYVGTFGVMGDKSPLVNFKGTIYTVTR